MTDIEPCSVCGAEADPEVIVDGNKRACRPHFNAIAADQAVVDEEL